MWHLNWFKTQKISTGEFASEPSARSAEVFWRINMVVVCIEMLVVCLKTRAGGCKEVVVCRGKILPCVAESFLVRRADSAATH